MLEKILPQTRNNDSRSNLSRGVIPVEDLIQHAHKLTESCIHLDQVMISRDFVIGVARRCAKQGKYTMDDVWRIGIVVNTMAENKVRRILCASDLRKACN